MAHACHDAGAGFETLSPTRWSQLSVRTKSWSYRTFFINPECFRGSIRRDVRSTVPTHSCSCGGSSIKTNGRACLARYIDNLHRASTDPLADLSAQFPALGEKAAEKNWKARVAQFARGKVTSCSLSRKPKRAFRNYSQSRSTTPRPIGCRIFCRARFRPPQSLALKRLSQELMLLSSRAHPILRPIVVEYQQIAASLAAGKTSGLKQRLARLESLRTQIAERMNKIDDYMNWFEATQARAESGAFTDYLNAVEEQNKAPRRHDPLSVYLDAIEEQFQD